MVLVLPKQLTSTRWLVANGQGTPCQACIARKSQCNAVRPRCDACVLISQSRRLTIARTPNCTYLEPSPDSAATSQDDPTSIADQLFDQHAAERKAKRQKRTQELEERLKLMEDKLKARRSSSKKDAIPVFDYTPLTPLSAEERDALLRSLVPRKIPSPPPRHLPPTLEPLYTRRFEEVGLEVSWNAAHLGRDKNLATSSPHSGSNRSRSSSGHSEASAANEHNRKHSTTTLMTTTSSIWPPNRGLGGGPPHSPDSSRSNHSGGSPKLHGSNVASTSNWAAYQDRPVSSISSYYPTHHAPIDANMLVQYAPYYLPPTQGLNVDLRPGPAKSEAEYVAHNYPPTYQTYIQPQLVPPDGLRHSYRGDHLAEHVWDQRPTSTTCAYPVNDGGRHWGGSPDHGHIHHHQQQTHYPNTQEYYPPLKGTYPHPLGSRNPDGQDFSHIYPNNANHESTGAVGYGGFIHRTVI